MEREQVFKPKHHIDELIATRLNHQIETVVTKATEENLTRASVPGLTDILTGEVRALENPIDDVSEN